MNPRYEYAITNDEIYAELDSESSGNSGKFALYEAGVPDGMDDDWYDDDDCLLYDDILYDGTISSLLQ